MRPFKFRAWASLDGEPMMWYSRDRQLQLVSFGSEGTPDTVWLNGITTRSFALMQYTGLKDKNGVEIYEGDIVHNAVSGARVEVRWQGEVNTVYWGTEVVKDEVTGWVPFCTGWANYIRTTGFEVIGNVHANPDLLGTSHA